MFIDTKDYKRTYFMPVGTMGFISWKRLMEVFQQSGEFKENEKVTHLDISERGISFKVDRR